MADGDKDQPVDSIGSLIMGFSKGKKPKEAPALPPRDDNEDTDSIISENLSVAEDADNETEI
jgi:hypothetical protein